MGGTKSGLVARHQACWPMKVSVRNVTALFAGDCFFFERALHFVRWVHLTVSRTQFVSTRRT